MRKIGFIHPIVIVAVLLTVFATGYLLFFNQSNTQQQKPPDSSTIVSQPEIHWKTYTNDFLKFSINYPIDWSVADNKLIVQISDSSSILDMDPANISRTHIYMTVTSNAILREQNVEDYLKDLDSKRKIKVISSENLSQFEKTALRRVEELGNESKNYKRIAIYVLDNNRIVTIAVTPADSEFMPIFDQMLQAFKFI